ncbi:MAG TPA: polyprenyl diphosphate synthase [Candidatus Paceibacterota bacterium]
MPENPKAIAVIMDGNRRWARERGLPALAGHEAGARKMRELIDWARETEIKQVTAYAFSTENWNRSEEEVQGLMKLAERFLAESGKRFEDEKVRVRFIGERERFSAEFQESMGMLEERTKEGDVTLILALSYGGRSEIVAATNQLLAAGKESVSEGEFSEALWTKGLLDPDILIRTGGEQRLSGFLPWQSVYSELFFTDTKWPDFGKEEFLEILDAYRARERRRGK